MLALFWASRWGRSAIHCSAHNDAVMYAQYVRCLLQQLDEHRAAQGITWRQRLARQAANSARWRRPALRLVLG